MLNFALKYLSQGLSIIPLKPKGKEPLIYWTEYQQRCPTVDEVRSWWTTWPSANIGVVTGKVSGIAVVDLDGLEGMQKSQELGIQSSCVSLTGHGKHLWYKHPGVNVNNAVKILPGIDVRGDAGYVVVAPSVHPNGQRYRWTRIFGGVMTLPKFPAGLLSVGSASEGITVKPEFKPKLDISKALQEMTFGNIDTTLHRICSKLRADNWSVSDALVLLKPHAERAGATPGHLETKIENAWGRYEPNERKTNSQARYSNSESAGLIIHSPTNPESLKRFESSRTNQKFDGRESLQTGYTKLDQMLQGGLKSSRLFTIAARTGVGKTNWLLGVCRALCEAGKTVLLFSTEMPYEQIWERYLQTLTNNEQFRKHKFYVCDSFAPNLDRVEEAINEIKPDVFMFDHINHVSEEQKELGAFMQGLNYLRRKYDCAGLVTAQLNRSADFVDIKTGEKVTPRMSMIKGSGTIEQASSRVLLLSETKVLPEGTEIVGNLDKNDKGPKGLVHFMLKTNPYQMVEV